MDKKILVIGGLTATGKTDLAIEIANRYQGELISADSRQVYKRADIVTGKDIPVGWWWERAQIDEKLGYFTDGIVRIWLVDVVGIWEKFSVGKWVDLAEIVIKDIWQRGKLPIVVGGSGSYISSITGKWRMNETKIDERLRKGMEGRSVEELMKILESVDKERATSMNHSDRNNARRVIRAIEVAKNSKTERTTGIPEKEVLEVILWTNTVELEKRIKSRVEKRLAQGAIEETKMLSAMRMKDAPVMTSPGYLKINDYLGGKTGEEEMKKGWIEKEMKEAKKQLTWFRKYGGKKWFEVGQSEWKSKLIIEIDKWYTGN